MQNNNTQVLTNCQQISSIDNVIGKTPLYLFIHMNGCGHCDDMKPAWKTFVDAATNLNEKVVLADFDSSLILKSANKSIKDVSGFPTLLYFPKSGTRPISYDDFLKALTPEEIGKKVFRSAESFRYWVDRTLLGAAKQRRQQGGNGGKGSAFRRNKRTRWSSQRITVNRKKRRVNKNRTLSSTVRKRK